MDAYKSTASGHSSRKQPPFADPAAAAATTALTMSREIFDQFGLDRYMESRLNEMFGPDFANFFLGDWSSPTTVTRPGIAGTSALTAAVPPPSSITTIPETAITPFESDFTSTDITRPFSGWRSRMLSPRFIRLNVSETKDAYKVKAELPGIPKENIKVHVDDNQVLSIDATPMDEERVTTSGSEEEGEKMHLVERRKERLYRAIRMPKNANLDNVTSKMENGVLCITFGKVDEEKNRRKIELQ